MLDFYFEFTMNGKQFTSKTTFLKKTILGNIFSIAVLLIDTCKEFVAHDISNHYDIFNILEFS